MWAGIPSESQPGERAMKLRKAKRRAQAKLAHWLKELKFMRSRGWEPVWVEHWGLCWRGIGPLDLGPNEIEEIQ